MANYKEENLIAELNNGKAEAFEKVHKLYVSRIYRFVYFKVSDTEKTEELVQDVFLKFWKHIDGGGKVNNISALLYRIAKNSVIDYYRSRDYKRIEISIDEVISDDLIVEDDVEKDIDIACDIKMIERALPRLPEPYREVIILKFVEEKSHSEIAEILDKEENNVRILSHRALKALRQIILSNQNE